MNIGLWNKESKKGTTYATGKVTIGGKECKITLFKNENKKSEKSPDYNILIEDSINTQEDTKIPVKMAKNGLKDDVFKDFQDIEANEVAF